MSGLPGNPYADSLDSYADPRNSLEASATLVLAYEQRTANLIGLAAHCAKMGNFDAVEKIGHSVLERLGLHE